MVEDERALGSSVKGTSGPNCKWDQRIQMVHTENPPLPPSPLPGQLHWQSDHHVKQNTFPVILGLMLVASLLKII